MQTHFALSLTLSPSVLWDVMKDPSCWAQECHRKDTKSKDRWLKREKSIRWMPNSSMKWIENMSRAYILLQKTPVKLPCRQWMGGKNTWVNNCRETQAKWVIQWYSNISHLYQFTMVFPVPHCTLVPLAWAMLCKSPCACVSQRTVQQISSGINTSRYARALSWDPFTEARDSHWLMDKKWIKHFPHSAHCERQFAWVLHTSESSDTAFPWLFVFPVYCLSCVKVYSNSTIPVV